MNKYLEIGIDEFNKQFQAGLEELTPGQNVRAGGKPTKDRPFGEDATWWKQNAPAYIQSWITWRQANPGLHILQMEDGSPAIELKVSAQIQVDEDESVELRGYIDRVFIDENTRKLLIVDLKTGKMTPDALQLAFYRRALKATYGLDAQHGAYWMARDGKLSSIENLEGFTDEVVDYWVTTTFAGVRNEIFLPNVSRLCGTCGVRKHCYVFNPDARFSPINTHMTEASKEAHNG